MTVKSCLAILLLGWCALAPAQAPLSDEGDPARIERERARIAGERSAAEARFGQQEAACYQRFAVNDCLREVRVHRRAAFEELRRQEILLNDAERRSRAAEQMQRLEEKTSPQAEREAAERRETAREEQQQRLERSREKQAERAELEGRSPQARSPEAPASTAGRAAQARQEYEEKQREAQERRERRGKALSDKAAQPPVRSLPTPP